MRVAETSLSECCSARYLCCIESKSPSILFCSSAIIDSRWDKTDLYFDFFAARRASRSDSSFECLVFTNRSFSFSTFIFRTIEWSRTFSSRMSLYDLADGRHTGSDAATGSFRLDAAVRISRNMSDTSTDVFDDCESPNSHSCILHSKNFVCRAFMSASPTDSRWKICLGDLSITSSSPIHPQAAPASFEDSPSLRGCARAKVPVLSASVGAFSSWSGPLGRENACLNGRENVKANSLTKLQLEKWNLQDQIKILEAQVRSRDVLIQENQQLRDELTEAVSERDSFKQKYTELASKLSAFIKKEKADRKHVDSEICKTKKVCDSIELDRERILEEKNRLVEELDFFKAECIRLKDIASQSVDRESLERQKQDILQENSQLRLMLEDSIPKCLYQRLEHQLTETIATASSNGANLRELQIDNQRLLSRLNTLEVTEVQNSTRILELEKDLKHTQDTLTFARRQLLAEKESLEEKSSKTICDLQEKLQAMENRCRLCEQVSHDQTKLEEFARRVNHVRESSSAMKVEFLNMKRSVANAVQNNLEKILSFHHRVLKLIGHEINCIMAESGFLEDNPQAGLSESIEALRTLVIRLGRECKSARTAVDGWVGEVEALKLVVSEKDSIIDGLALRLSNFDKAKRAERASIARLRNSIESAERTLNASRLQD